MKLLSIIIPCYNSENYMKYCIESLLPGGDDVEILIVNDGSKDKTAEIAEMYASKYPSIIKAIHQENGGHGELDAIKDFNNNKNYVDMIISNFVYEKENAKFKKVMKYDNVLPEGKIFTWDDIGTFRKGQYILMHSVIYRTEVLKECGLVLPKHTFYVDNLFVYLPLKNVNKMFYINTEFYRYLIGREDQSVNEKVMIKRIDQQIKVNKLMIENIDLEDISNKKLYKYMINYLEIITAVSGVLLIRSGTKENLEKKKELWKYIKDKDVNLYRTLRYKLMGQLINLPGLIGRKICIGIYKISQLVVGFN